jgi:hypothetical protein
MKLETYAAKHGADVSDWSETLGQEAAARGWKCLALFTMADDCEPDMLLIKSPTWPNYQVRDLASGIPSGTMLTEQKIKEYIKAKAA